MRVFLNMGIYLEQIKCGKTMNVLSFQLNLKGTLFSKNNEGCCTSFYWTELKPANALACFSPPGEGPWHRFLLFVNLLVFLPFRYSKTVSFVVHRKRTCRFPAVRRAPTPLCQIKCQRKIIRCQGKYETHIAMARVC